MERKQRIQNLLKKYEKDILNLLKEELPTSRVQHELNIGFYKVKDLLIELEKQGKIKSRTEGKFVYWSMK